MTVAKLSPVPESCAWRGGFVGVSGTGKSFAAKAFVAAHMKAHPKTHRVVAFDPCDEWSKKGLADADKGPLLERVTFDELMRDPSRLDVEPLSLAVVPSDDEEESAAEVFELVALAKSTGHLLLVFDEVGDYGFHPTGQKALSIVARKGRHWKCPALFVAQRLTHLPPNARSQLTELVTFFQSHPADVRALEDLTGDKQFAAKVQRLDVQKRESLTWRGATAGGQDNNEEDA